VSGGMSSTDPTAVVSSGWTAADEFLTQRTKQPDSTAATWHAATTLPPPAVARAEATSAPRKKLAQRTPDWSPFRN
jgi:hypothetical protein